MADPPGRRAELRTDGGVDRDGETGDAEYVFSVVLQLSPPAADVRLEPDSVETTLFRQAAPPGADEWLFFRDNLWRGEINDRDHLRRWAEERIDIDIRSIEFREFRTDETYFEAMKEEVAENLAAFRADDVAEVINKYLGSRVHVRER